MTHGVMVDTSALVGAFLEDDQRHDDARRVLAQLQRDRRVLLSTSDVFSETVTLLRRWGGYDVAVEKGQELRESGVLRFCGVDDAARDAAWSLFRKHRIPGLSFIDCTTAALMGRLGVEEIFTFDSDFRKLGFAVLPARR